jgi:hypothetical protein
MAYRRWVARKIATDLAQILYAISRIGQLRTAVEMSVGYAPTA